MSNAWEKETDKRISELEKIVIGRHKLGVKGEYYFSNKQIAIETNEKEIAELREEMKTIITPYNYSEIEITINNIKDQLNELEKRLDTDALQIRLEAYDAHTKEIAELRELSRDSLDFDMKFALELNELKKASGGEKDEVGDAVRAIAEKNKGSPLTSSKPPEPKCKTCGQELSMDLNGDYFCMKSVIMEEKHDDNHPSPFIQVKREDLQILMDCDLDWEDVLKLKEKYGIL